MRVFENTLIHIKDNISGFYVYLTTRKDGLFGVLFSGGVFSGSSSS